MNKPRMDIRIYNSKYIYRENAKRHNFAVQSRKNALIVILSLELVLLDGVSFVPDNVRRLNVNERSLTRMTLWDWFYLRSETQAYETTT